MLHRATFAIACYETNLRRRLGGPAILVIQNPPNGTIRPGGQAAPDSQIHFQVLPGTISRPQQQIYVPVQVKPVSCVLL